MSTPPDQPADSKANQPIEKQLDALLSQIEAVEPGTVDSAALPKSVQAHNPTPKAENSAAAAPTDEEIAALLNDPPTAAAPAEPMPTNAATAEQSEMLASLNSALQSLPSDTPSEQIPAAEAGKALSIEDQLQQEITALMDAEPQPAVATATDATANEPDDFDMLAGSFEPPEALMAAASQANTPSTEDQIAMEIEGLLGTDQPSDQAPPEAAIDELDKMLASEIDADDELAGDFQSVEDVTAGIQADTATNVADDEHAATARDVAAELDTQPEDLPAPPPVADTADEPVEDPYEALSNLPGNPEQDKPEHQRQAAMESPGWQHWLEVGKENLLNACFLINWPARRFLSAEWRANLGYIALLNLFFGVGLWLVLIVF